MRIDKRVEVILKADIMTLFGVDEKDLPAYDQAMGTSTEDERAAAFRRWIEGVWAEAATAPFLADREDDFYLFAGCTSPPINLAPAQYFPAGKGTAKQRISLAVPVQDVIDDDRAKWVVNIINKVPEDI